LVKKVEAGDDRAFEELARILAPARRALIHRVLRRWHVTNADFEDAEQVALTMTFPAAKDFGFAQAARDRCSFPSYAWKLIGREVSKFARGEWRRKRPYEHSAKSAEALEKGGRNKRRGTDPVEEAARREGQHRLEELFAGRPKALRRFWELRVAGMKLPTIARELGITARQAKRWEAEKRWEKRCQESFPSAAWIAAVAQRMPAARPGQLTGFRRTPIDHLAERKRVPLDIPYYSSNGASRPMNDSAEVGGDTETAGQHLWVRETG
jgi:hypothetical protein